MNCPTARSAVSVRCARSFLLLGALALAACTATPRYVRPDPAPRPSRRPPAAQAPAPAEAEAPAFRPGQVLRGQASWYGAKFHGRPTASGEPFDMNRVSGAHRELPLGTWVQVTNLANGRKLEVPINDRGPFKSGRVLDLSREAARRLGYLEDGVADVEIRVLTLP